MAPFSIKFNKFGTWCLNRPRHLFYSFCCITRHIFDPLHVYEPGFNTDKSYIHIYLHKHTHTYVRMHVHTYTYVKHFYMHVHIFIRGGAKVEISPLNLSNTEVQSFDVITHPNLSTTIWWVCKHLKSLQQQFRMIWLNK